MEMFTKEVEIQLRHGWGKMTYNNGDVYEGEWENNKENLEAWKKDWREKNKEKITARRKAYRDLGEDVQKII